MVSSLKTANKVNIKKAPVQNPVVKGNFQAGQDYREVAICRFNHLLSFLLVGAILISLVSYSLVVAKENTLVNIHNKTNEMNFENIELQNKVDYARSFYNINEKISKISFLKKADKIIEVNSLASAVVSVNPAEDNGNFQTIAGY